MIKDLSFGTLFREIRIENGETLRQYCIRRGFDSGNISKMERSLIAPPYNLKQLYKYLSGLEYNELQFEFLIAACMNYHIGAAARRFEINVHKVKTLGKGVKDDE